MLGMVTEIVSGFLFEKAAEPRFEAMRERWKDRALDQALEGYQSRFRAEKWEHQTHEEEFDLDGLNDFLEEYRERFTALFYVPEGQKPEVRQALYHKALRKAETGERQAARRVVTEYLDGYLEILNSFLDRNEDPALRQMAGEIEGDLRAAIREAEEKLHNHIDYRGSFAERLDHLPQRRSRKLKYHYRNPDIGFFGRTEELKYLDQFLEEPDEVLYTVITGPGGIGKSKLLYHYVRMNQNDPDWRMVELSEAVLQEFAWNYTDFAYEKDLFLVVDYVGRCPDTLGQLMDRMLNGDRPGKVRLVLLERPNPQRGVLPDWYRRMLEGRSELEEYLYRDTFYELKQMERESLMALMDNIAQQEGRRLTERDREEIYRQVCSFVQGDTCGSPLYAILTTDALLHGIPLNTLDTGKLMKYVLERDETYWRDVICGGDEELYDSFKELLVYATATGGWDFSPLGEPLAAEADCLRKIGNKGNSAVWQRFSQLTEENGKGEPVLRALEPDLIGEYFVLSFLLNQRSGDRYRQRIGLFWEKPEPYWYFVNRCIDSYLYRPEFQTLLYGEKTLFCDRGEEEAVLSAQLFANLSVKQDLAGRERTVEQLRALSEQYPGNAGIAWWYVQSFLSLNFRRNPGGQSKTVEQLPVLSKEAHSGNVESAEKYAQSLVVLSFDQDRPGCEEMVKQLLVLSEQYPKNAKIALECTKGLVNLSIKQGLAGREQTAEQLRVLSEEQYLGDAEIAEAYAQGLVNLSNKQDLAGCEETVEQLRALSEEQYPGNAEIALEYAKGLVSLSVGQDLTEQEQTAEKLRKLSEERYPGNAKIALEYAKGLVCLSNKQDLTECEKTVEKLRKLNEERYPGNAEIALRYAVGLAVLCAKERTEEAVMEEGQRFYQTWQADPEEAARQAEQEPDRHLKALKMFLVKHPYLFPKFMEWLMS